jgi:tetratricopeptide (TPR) repeat protein
LDAAEVVCGCDLDTLGSLLDKSLIRRRSEDNGDERLWMLETIREYAAERLAASGERDAVVDAHAERALAVLEPGEPRLRSAEQLDQLAVVRRIEGEAVRALERAVADADGARAHRLLAALAWSWVVRGDMAVLLRWSTRVAELPAGEPGMAVAVNRSLRSVLLASQPDTSGAHAEIDAVLAMRPALSRPWHPVVALLGPATRAFTDGDRSELVVLADAEGDPWLRAAAAQTIAMHAENVGEPEVRRRYLRLAHDLFSALGDRFGLGITTSSLGEVEDLGGDRSAARRAIMEAISLSEELHKVDDLPQHRMQLAVLAARDGDEAEARAQLRLADAAIPSPEPWTTAWLRWGRADVERRLKNPAQALALLGEPLPPLDDDPGPGWGQRQALVHHLTAAALIDLGRHDEARTELDSAAAAALDSDDGPVLGQVAETAARWALAAGDAERAGELLGVALARRGTLNLGDPEVVATRDGVVGALGRSAADAAIERGRAVPRDVAPRPLSGQYSQAGRYS